MIRSGRFISVLLIFVLAAVLRSAFAWQYISNHPPQALAIIPFLFEPGNIAASLADGHGFSSPFRVETGPTAWMTPVYPLLLASIFRTFGSLTFQAFIAAVTLNVLFSSLVCIPLASLPLRGARLAAMLWAVFPNAILLTNESLWDDSLSALLAATLLWATFRLRDSKTAWALYGLLWGLALMTNAAFIIVLPFLFAYLRRHDWRRHAIASSMVILCCLPWTVRNFRAFNAFVPLRSNAGIALWLGNNGESDGRPQGWLHPIANPAEREKYIEMGELAYAHAKQQEALHYIAAHPLITMTSAGTRFIEWWTGGGWRIRSLRGALVIPFNALAAAGAFSGLWLLYRKRSPHLLPFAAFVLVFPLIYYFTLAIPRYRLPADPAILSLAAYACVHLANYKKGQVGPLTVT